MPTERFLRLPQGKIKAIRQAALHEFQRATIEKASINQVIQEADISRGSFYTYFTDKQDLLEWLIGDQVQDYMSIYGQDLAKCGGDIWAVFDKSFDNCVEQIRENGLVEIVTNLIASNSFSDSFRKLLNGDPEKEEMRNRYIRWLYEHCDKRQCPGGFETFADLMEIQMLMLVTSLKRFFGDELPREQAEACYRRHIELLHYGVCPKEPA